MSTELENLIDLKNVSQYQLLKGLKDMTQELNVPELSNNNLILMRQLLEVTQLELAKKIGVSERTVWGIENGTQKISDKFVDKFLLVYLELAESIEVQFDWVSLTFPDLTSMMMCCGYKKIYFWNDLPLKIFILVKWHLLAKRTFIYKTLHQ